MDLHIDLRPVDILRAIGGLEKYLDVMEAQMEEVRRIERHTLELQHPADADEEEHQLHWNELNYLDDLYERDLQPAMRYSFVVLVHIVFESQLRNTKRAFAPVRRIGVRHLGRERGAVAPDQQHAAVLDGRTQFRRRAGELDGGVRVRG